MTQHEQANHTGDLGPVAVLYGGPSREAEVSAKTAKTVCASLARLGYAYEMIDLQEGWIDRVCALKPCFVFLALHGVPGEDGTVQGVLELMKLPYNGSGVLSSALAMDKPKAKTFFKAMGLDVGKEVLFEDGSLPEDSADIALDMPYVVKPAAEGSSVGICMVHTNEDWAKAREIAAQIDGPIMVEEFLAGRELTVALLDGEPLAVMEIQPKSDSFYSYESKYGDDGFDYLLPAPLPQDVYNKAMDVARTANDALDCTGMTRVDIIYNETENRLSVLEINTLPGLNVLYPKMAQQAGYSFDDLMRQTMKGAHTWQKVKVA